MLVILLFLVQISSGSKTERFVSKAKKSNPDLPTQEVSEIVPATPQSSKATKDAEKSGSIDPKFFLLRKYLKSDKAYYPDDNFYSEWDGSDDTLRLMASKILMFLCIKPKDLFVGFYDQMEPPGLFIQTKKGETDGLLINSKYRNNPFECGAILAHELMHYFLMAKKKIVLEDDHENELLTDLATIQAGLGILVMNGFYHYSGWHETIIALCFGFIRTHQETKSFGYFKPNEYGEHLGQYLKEKNLDIDRIYSHVLPHARHFTHWGKSTSEEKPDYIQRAEKIAKKDLIKRLVLVSLALPIGLTLLYFRVGGTDQNISPENQQQIEELKEKIDDGKANLDKCDSELEIIEKELSDIEIKMKSYNDQNLINLYNSYVPRQNELVSQIQDKNTECLNIQNETNKQVDEYNNLIK